MSRFVRSAARAVASVLLALALTLGAAVVLGRRRFENTVDTHVEELRSDASVPADGRFTAEDLSDLPAPVRRYFEHVLPEGQPYVQRATFRYEGEFRLGGDTWQPFTALQEITTRPPGFVWDATVEVAPLLSVHVLDVYKRGNGILRASLLGAVPVAAAGPNPGMNEGELVRYLAEGVWVPTALLPAQGVEWEGIDDRTARATLEHQDVTASVVFHFDENDEVERVTAERYRQEDDGYAPWAGYFGEYETKDGMHIPVEGEVEWTLTEGELSYWRATIEDIQYHTAEQESRLPA